MSGSSKPVLPTFTILISASAAAGHLTKAQPTDWLSHASALSVGKLLQLGVLAVLLLLSSLLHFGSFL